MLGQMTYDNFVDRYRDKDYIGSGGFAKVYKVFDYANNHFVALKVADVRPEFKKFTLQNEVELLNQLADHENIVRYENCYRFNTGITGEMDFAILPYYERGNLEQFLKKVKISAAEKKQIILGILKGVQFLHSNNIIHRDLKAENILIHQENEKWIPKIADFGLGRNVAGEDSAVSNSSIGVSFEYASPEQIKNTRIYKNVDLWAVGALIFRIMANISPFRHGIDTRDNKVQSQLEISRRIMARELPEAYANIPEPYKSIINNCLVVDPQARVKDARILLSLLGESVEALDLQHESIAAEKTELIQPKQVEPTPAIPNTPPDHYDEKTEIINQPSRQAPQPKQDFQYQPRTNFDLPVYQHPRKNVTQVISPSSAEQGNRTNEPQAPRIKTSASGEGFNKLWIYIPIFFLLTVGAVWLLYIWLNPTIEKPAVVESIEIPQEPISPGIDPAFLDCYENGKDQLQGIIKLTPTRGMSGGFASMDANCLDQICTMLNEVRGNAGARMNFYAQAKNGNSCFAPLLETSLQYHHQQIITNASIAVFYNSGQSDLSIAQKNELNTFLKSYKKNARQYGLLIIGRASNIGNANANQLLSRRRAESIIDFVSNHYIKNLKTEFVYFGANPPQLTKAIADDYGIPKNKYNAIKHGSGNDQNYTLRLNQSVLLVMYEKKEDPFDLEKSSQY